MESDPYVELWTVVLRIIHRQSKTLLYYIHTVN